VARRPADNAGGEDATGLTVGGLVTCAKAGFQKSGMMDYGILYGVGSYFEQDRTAFPWCDWRR
jgi:nitric oxide reductase large subunit